MLLLHKKGLDAVDAHSMIDVMRLKLLYVMFDTPALEILVRVTGESKAEIRRKIKQGGITIGDQKITDQNDMWSSGNAACMIYIGREPVGLLMPLTNVRRYYA